MKVLLTSVTSDAGAAAAQALARAGHEVIGVDLHPTPSWGRPRYLQAYHAVTTRERHALGQALVRILDAHPCDILLPVGTVFLRATIAEHAALSLRAAMAIPSAAAFSAAYDKEACQQTLAAAGVPAPQSLAVAAAKALLERGVTDRVVVKPAWDVGASHGLVYVREPTALAAAVADCEARFETALVQEYIPGETRQMRALTVLFDRRGRLVAGFALQKTRQAPSTGGVTVAAHSIPMEPLLNVVQPFFDVTGWVGPAEVEFKRDPRDGLDKVIEVNPRFPGYLRFPCALGVNLPALTLAAAVDTDLGPRPPYALGAHYVAPTRFLTSLREQARAEGWPRALRTGIPEAIHAAGALASMMRDPLPPLARLMRRGAGAS